MAIAVELTEMTSATARRRRDTSIDDIEREPAYWPWPTSRIIIISSGYRPATRRRYELRAHHFLDR
jgi:hypothetical protein